MGGWGEGGEVGGGEGEGVRLGLGLGVFHFGEVGGGWGSFGRGSC